MLRSGLVTILTLLVLTACGTDRIIELGTDGGSHAADVVGMLDVGGVDVSTTGDIHKLDDAGLDDAVTDTAASEDALVDLDHTPLPDAEPDLDAVAPPQDITADDSTAPDVAPADVPEGPDAAEDAVLVDVPADTAGDVPHTEDTTQPDVPEVVYPTRLDVDVEETLDGGDFWADIERCFLDHDALTPELFIPKTRQTDEGAITNFGGDAEPPSGRFLLYAAPGWEDAEGLPILLVHGAGSEPNQSFVDPDMLGLDPGLARDLSDAGHAVFAIGFPARYGSNWNQGLQLAAAIQRVRQRTGAVAVHVLAHSKGGLPVLAYLTDMLADRGVPFDGDVARVALVAVPIGGMDFSFRHPNFNYASSIWNFELPTSWDQALEWGVWQDLTEESIYGGAYDGLLEALARWDEEYTLSMVEQDWYTTYEGGQGFFSHSLGIDAAIEQGGQFMAQLRARTLPESLEVGVLVGTNPYVGVTAWELAGPSDCLVFTASAGDTDWLEGAGANVVASESLFLNHWELVHGSEAREWVRQLFAD